MRLGVAHGLHALALARARSPARTSPAAAMFMLLSQAEAGLGCPISMTYSVIPALRTQPELAAEWEPRFLSLDYDARAASRAGEKARRALRHGDDREAGRLRRAREHHDAAPLNGGGPGASTRSPATSGSARRRCATPSSCSRRPTAASPASSCRASPPTASATRFHIQRLKDKLGNRSNASSEVEFRGAWARLVGEEGRGVPTIIEMVNHTRLDCVIGSAAGMRAGVAQAIHHAAHRSAFGKLLVDQPLMQNVLADLALESEAATIVALRLARAYDDRRRGRGRARSFKRLANAVLEVLDLQAGAAHAVEALECLGGNGYVEESGMPRLYRESPLNSIWEGSGNVLCLDVLRAMVAQPARARGVLRRGRARERSPSRGWTPSRRKLRDELATTPRRSRPARAASSSGWRSRCRARCWSATATRPSPTPSAPRAWTATGARPSARCPPAPTSSASSSATPVAA